MVVLFGSGIIAGVLDRAPRLIWLGAIALIWTSADMILGDPAVDPHLPDHIVLSAGLAVLILAAVQGALLLRRRAETG